MKIRECNFKYNGWHPTWITPAIIVDVNRYSEDIVDHYKFWFQIEIVWLAFDFTLWVEFNKVRN